MCKNLENSKGRLYTEIKWTINKTTPILHTPINYKKKCLSIS